MIRGTYAWWWRSVPRFSMAPPNRPHCTPALTSSDPVALNRRMTESQSSPATPQPSRPHEFDHSHGDVSGGWLRAATFGAMDGLVSNTALIAGVGAAADAHTVVISGFAGLVA